MPDTFDDVFHSVLNPRLRELGFKRVYLEACIFPEYLFNNGDVWFALSWDWRDRYLEVSLGKLYWFKDVMKRVVVIGDYSNYESRITPTAMDTLDGEETVLSLIASSMAGAIDRYHEAYVDIYEEFRVSRSQCGGIHIDDYIGAEVRIADLDKYRA